MAKKEESSIVQKKKADVVKSEEITLDKATERYFLFLQNMYANEVEKYEKSQIFLFPFYVDELFLKKLNSEIADLLNAINGNVEIEFSSNTRFQDLSTIRIDSFDVFLEKAGNKKDPENSTLTWKKFFVDNIGEIHSGQISISFVTEKSLKNEDMPAGEFYRASIQLNVTGANLDWVERSFENLLPYIDSTKLSGIYRPLWFFRNKNFINILSMVLGWVGFYVGIDISSNILKKDTEFSKVEILEQIFDTTNLNDKIDLLSQQILNPIKSVWWEPIVMILFGALAFAVIYFSGMNLFPRLTPNSHIAIGLANIRANKYMNAFKFVVFTLLLSGIILPLIIKLL